MTSKLIMSRQSYGPMSTRAEVIAVDRCGACWRIEVQVPALTAPYAAGQFVGVTVGDDLGMLLRRYFSVLTADPATGLLAFVVAVHSRGTAWLARRRPGDELDILGPLGEPFPTPPPGTISLAVAHGHGGAGLFRLVRDGVERGDEVHVLLGASSADRLFAPNELGHGAASLTVSTEDGSAGVLSSVCDLLDETLDRCHPDLVYACGPMPMLRAVSEQLAGRGPTVYVATEAAMACGIGVCLTCVLPVIGADGVTRMTRSCVGGPVFRSDRIRWADIGTVPADCWGA